MTRATPAERLQEQRRRLARLLQKDDELIAQLARNRRDRHRALRSIHALEKEARKAGAGFMAAVQEAAPELNTAVRELAREGATFLQQQERERDAAATAEAASDEEVAEEIARAIAPKAATAVKRSVLAREEKQRRARVRLEEQRRAREKLQAQRMKARPRREE